MISRQIRKVHQWFALITALQMLIWLMSGLYMVMMDIDFIRGEQLVKPTTPTQITSLGYSFTQLLEDHPDALQPQLIFTASHAFYQFKLGGQTIVINAQDGTPLPAIAQQDIIAKAQSLYSGQGKIINAHRLDTDLPAEISPKLAPVWQVNFDDFAHTSLYFSAISGELVSKRHNYWRIFDFMWMLHIMDYDEREDIHNRFLRILAMLGVLTASFGLALTYVSFRQPKETKRC